METRCGQDVQRDLLALRAGVNRLQLHQSLLHRQLFQSRLGRRLNDVFYVYDSRRYIVYWHLIILNMQ